jgi:hypothetical protein
MKKLINGMFSSIPDAEFIAQTFDVNSAAVESDVQTNANDKPEEPSLPDVGEDDWLPS